jgi:hypothetical protein
MKLKNKIYTLLSVFTLVSLTHSLTLKDLNAALTAPSGWTFKYTNEDFPGFKIRSTTAVITTPQYTITTDGAYYNYTNTSTIITGFSVTQTFNRSNTTWYNNTGLYVPSSSNIGSDATVGSLSNKFLFTFNNQTNKDYKLFFDMSSTSGGRQLNYQINTQTIITWSSSIIWVDPAHMFNLYIPSYSIVNVGAQPTNTSSSYYFDAWYLQDLGINNAYDAGYDAGLDAGYDDGYSDGLNNNPNILLNGFQAMVGILVNFVLMIVNLEVFGVSIMGIFSIVVLFTGIVWVLKLIRG